MTRYILLSTILGLAANAANADEEPGKRMSLRILSYNIHHGEGLDKKLDLERIARVIKESRPDLVALQEVDRKTRRTNGVDQTAVLGQLTGLHARFGKAMSFDGGEYGQAILSRFPISEPTVHILPGKPGQETRIAVEVKVTMPSRQFRFVGTHFQHDDGPTREMQAKKINNLFSDDMLPTILAGDLNAVPNSEPIQLLSKAWTFAIEAKSAPTVPAKEPRHRIDYVLVRPAKVFRVIEVKVIAEPVASDHRPVLAVIEWISQGEE